MTPITRRFLIAGAAASTMALTACDNSINSDGAARIDARVDQALNYLYSTYPGTQSLRDKAAGILVMPVMTEAGLGIGAGFGRGALRVGGVTVDYYAAAQASVGLQIGAQQYSHVLFFMTEEALQEFRASPGWVAGAGVEYAFRDQGEAIRADTITTTAPVVAVVFAQAGAIVGASLEGTKYTRIIP